MDADPIANSEVRYQFCCAQCHHHQEVESAKFFRFLDQELASQATAYLSRLDSKPSLLELVFLDKCFSCPGQEQVKSLRTALAVRVK